MKKIIYTSVILFANLLFAATSVWNNLETGCRDFTNTENWRNSVPFVNSVMIPSSDFRSPKIYEGSDIAFEKGNSIFVGSSRSGKLTIKGGRLSGVNSIEIGGDYWIGEGADGEVLMFDGIVSSSSTIIGSGNKGRLNILGGRYNTGEVRIGQKGARNGKQGEGCLTLSGGRFNSEQIIAGENSPAVITFENSPEVLASHIKLGSQGRLNFVLDYEKGIGGRVRFSGTNAADYELSGEISLSFAHKIAGESYELMRFNANLSDLDVSQLLCSQSAEEGWSIELQRIGQAASRLVARYDIDCDALIEKGYRAVRIKGGCVFAPESPKEQTHTYSTGMIADESILWRSPFPESVYISTPSIAVCPQGRLIASFQLYGNADVLNRIPEVKKGGRTFIYTSDDGGKNWQHRTNLDVMHSRLFIADEKVYVLGHMRDLRLFVSSDRGDTWSDFKQLTDGERWHASATNVWRRDNYVYMVMERYEHNVSDAWRVAELAPILLRGDINGDLMDADSWTMSSPGAFVDYIEDKSLDTYFGIPFYPSFYPDRYRFEGSSVSFSPLGWLEGNVVQITDSNHYLYDSDNNTFHLFLRANTGLTNFASMMKAVEKPDGTIETMFEKAPSGRRMMFVNMPGGHMRFHILYDEQTNLYWLLSTQSTDSMTVAQKLPEERFATADNERRRLQLSFSTNMFDWRFVGLVAEGDSDKQARHYASMDFDGDDIVIVSRSGDEYARSAHNGNIVTFHRIKNFRDLIY